MAVKETRSIESTLAQKKSKNIAKAKATAAIGYKHITLIFDNKGVNLVDTIVTV